MPVEDTPWTANPQSMVTGPLAFATPSHHHLSDPIGSLWSRQIVESRTRNQSHLQPLLPGSGFRLMDQVPDTKSAHVLSLPTPKLEYPTDHRLPPLLIDFTNFTQLYISGFTDLDETLSCATVPLVLAYHCSELDHHRSLHRHWKEQQEDRFIYSRQQRLATRHLSSWICRPWSVASCGPDCDVTLRRQLQELSSTQMDQKEIR